MSGLSPIRIIGIPTDLGQSLRGVDMGPAAVRYAGLATQLRKLGYPVEDAGNISVPVRDAVSEQERIWFQPAVKRICEDTYQAAAKARADGCIPIFLGGDHSVSIGTVGGVTHDGPTGVLWIDAHGDFNTPQTSPSGNIHGMALASLVGLGDPELVNLGRIGPKIRRQDIVMIAVRDIDPGEKELLRQSGICVYTMRSIDEGGIAAIASQAIAKLAHVDRLHVSLDMDCLDPTEAPGVGTPVPGGLTYREAQLLMEMLADTKHVASADVVEVNPILDERNETAGIAVDLVESLFGKSIL
jgi:arginase